MSTSLTGLKIPRGYRGDWPLFEYQLIDFVEQNLNEVEDSREGDSSLLANLNSKYATKTYVQLAILNPTPGDIFVTDLGVSGTDSAKVGYSLQINNAGTGLLFANTYKLGMGTFANPSLSFNSNSAGVYCSTDVTNETLHIKLNNFSVCDIIQNKISGVTLIDLGMLQLSSNGDIFAADIDADSINVLLDVGCRAVRTTGTGALNRSIMAEVEINKGLFTGTGSDATVIAEATITTLAVTTLDQGTVSLLSSVDLDTVKTTTKDYYANSGCTNMPTPGGGRLSVVFRNSNVVFQEFQGFSTPSTYTRYWNGTVWSTWLSPINSITEVTFSSATPDYYNNTGGLSVTYDIPPQKTALIILVGGGGAGGDGGPSASISGNPGGDSIIRQYSFGTILATAAGGEGGIFLTASPSAGSIGRADFSRSAAGEFSRFDTEGTLQIYPIFASTKTCSIDSPTAYALPNRFYSTISNGYGGKASQSSGIYGEKGMAGGVVVLTCKNISTGLLDTLSIDIGLEGTSPGAGLDGYSGAVYIWLSD